jgi:hypothetical protein
MAGLTLEARQVDDHDVIHATNLEHTLQELQGMVKEHEDALSKVRIPSRYDIDISHHKLIGI